MIYHDIDYHLGGRFAHTVLQKRLKDFYGGDYGSWDLTSRLFIDPMYSIE